MVWALKHEKLRNSEAGCLPEMWLSRTGWNNWKPSHWCNFGFL